eukprot:gene23211-28196_t
MVQRQSSNKARNLTLVHLVSLWVSKLATLITFQCLWEWRPCRDQPSKSITHRQGGGAPKHTEAFATQAKLQVSGSTSTRSSINGHATVNCTPIDTSNTQESTMPHKECAFCNSPKLSIVAENALAFAIRDTSPARPLHTLIIPKRHVVDIFETSADEREAMHELAVQCSEKICDEDPRVGGFNFGSNAIPICNLQALIEQAARAFIATCNQFTMLTLSA